MCKSIRGLCLKSIEQSHWDEAIAFQAARQEVLDIRAAIQRARGQLCPDAAAKLDDDFARALGEATIDDERSAASPDILRSDWSDL